MNLKEFAKKVKEMRKAQNDYFQLKKRGDITMMTVLRELLKRSNSLEKEVDVLVAEILAESTTQELF